MAAQGDHCTKGTHKRQQKRQLRAEYATWRKILNIKRQIPNHFTSIYENAAVSIPERPTNRHYLLSSTIEEVDWTVSVETRTITTP